MSGSLSARQRQTQSARAAMAAKFPTTEAKSAYYRAIAEKGNAGRVVLPVEDVRELVNARDDLARLTNILGSIATRLERHAVKEVTDDGDIAA